MNLRHKFLEAVIHHAMSLDQRDSFKLGTDDSQLYLGSRAVIVRKVDNVDMRRFQIAKALSKKTNGSVMRERQNSYK